MTTPRHVVGPRRHPDSTFPCPRRLVLVGVVTGVGLLVILSAMSAPLGGRSLLALGRIGRMCRYSDA